MRINFINPAKGSLKYKQTEKEGRGGGGQRVLFSYNRGDKGEKRQTKGGEEGARGALSYSP